MNLLFASKKQIHLFSATTYKKIGKNFGAPCIFRLFLASSETSPHCRATDGLFDALSTYFTATSERRRIHEKGEYLQLNKGLSLKRTSRFFQSIP